MGEVSAPCKWGSGRLERVLHVVDPRPAPVSDRDLDDIKPPRQIPSAKASEPGIRTPLYQCLLVFAHRIEAADLAFLAAGFHLDEKQELLISCDDIHLAPLRAAVIFGKNFAAARTQPSDGDPLAVFSKPNRVARFAISRCQTAGRVERPAETTDDGRYKGRESEALQDVF